jgi:hypothetical protein
MPRSWFDFRILIRVSNRIFLEFFVRVSSCSRIKPFDFRGSTVYICILLILAQSNLSDMLSCKGKAVPLQAWRSPGGGGGARKVRFPDFMTTAQDNGKVVSLTQRPALAPGNTPGTHFC